MNKVRNGVVDRYRAGLSNLKVDVVYQEEHGSLTCKTLIRSKFWKKKLEPNKLLLSELKNRNIGACVHYNPLHRQALYSSHSCRGLPVTEMVADNIITLPIVLKFLTGN